MDVFTPMVTGFHDPSRLSISLRLLHAWLHERIIDSDWPNAGLPESNPKIAPPGCQGRFFVDPDSGISLTDCEINPDLNDLSGRFYIFVQNAGKMALRYLAYLRVEPLN